MQNQAVFKPLFRLEPFLFAFVLFACLVPLLIPGFFITLDGPAHLYNARLIRELFFGNPLVERFFTWNPLPEPNWSGHLFMAVVGQFLSASQTMKALMALIIISTATGFRRLFLMTSPGAAWGSWLIFPWLYSFPLMMGFLNYSIGLAIFPWIIATWIKSFEAGKSKTYVLLFLLLFISYFSHLMLFGITFLVMLFFIPAGNRFFQNLKRLTLLALPFIVGGLFFILSKGSEGMHGNFNRLPIKELIQNFTTARPLIIFHMADEMPTGTAYALFLAVALVVRIWLGKNEMYAGRILLFLSTMMILHFVFPDDFAAGGIITVRIAQLSFLAIVWYVASSKMNVRFQFAFALISVLFTIKFYSLHHKISRQLAVDASEYLRVASYIPEGSVVLPLNYSDNWLHANLPAIAGAGRNLLMLDNYEADMLYFPLHWKEGLDPKLRYGNYASSRTPCIPFRELIATQSLPDAVLCWHMPEQFTDSCTIDANEQLLQHYRLAFAESSAKVFLLK